MTPSALHALQALDILLCHGEDVTLADDVIVQGVFDPIGTPAGPWGSEVGLTGRVSAQPNPLLHVPDAVAAQLHERDTLTVRGIAYVIVTLSPQGSGMTECALMPASASAADGLSRYR